MIRPDGITATLYGELRFMVTTRQDESGSTVYVVWDEQNQGYVCRNGFLRLEFDVKRANEDGYDNFPQASKFAMYLNERVDWTR